MIRHTMKMQPGTPLTPGIRVPLWQQALCCRTRQQLARDLVCQRGAESVRSSAKRCCFMAELCSLFSHTTIGLQSAFAHPAEWLAVLFNKALHAHKRFFQLIIGSAVGTAHITLASFAKRAARHNRYLLLNQQLLGESVIAQICSCN